MEKYIKMIINDLVISNRMLKSFIDKKLVNDNDIKEYILSDKDLLHKIASLDKSNLLTFHLLNRNFDGAYELIKRYNNLKFNCDNIQFIKCGEYDDCCNSMIELLKSFVSSKDIDAVKFIELIKYISKNGITNSCHHDHEDYFYLTHLFIYSIEKNIEIAMLIYVNFDITMDNIIEEYLLIDSEYITTFVKYYNDINNLDLTKSMTLKRKIEFGNYIKKKYPLHYEHLYKIFN